MMKVLRIDNKVISKYADLYLTEELNKEKTLEFLIDESYNYLIENEKVVDVDGELFRVKSYEKNSGEPTSVFCEYDLSDLEAIYYTEEKEHMGTPNQVITTLLKGTNWIATSNYNTKTRKVTGTNKSLYETIVSMREIYGLEITFDNKDKTIYLDREIGKVNRLPVTKDLNIRKLNFKSDTFDYFNIIKPEGKDGLTIKSINKGSELLKAPAVNGKEVYHHWLDERYEVAQNLKEDAERLLAFHSKPLIAYEIDFVDVSDIKGFDGYKLSLGDKITLWEDKSEHRVIKIVQNLNDKKDTVITLANKPIDLNEQQKNIESLVEKNDEVNKGKFTDMKDKMDNLQVDLNNEIDDKLKDYEDKFDKELAEAPQVTLDWLNQNAGVLDGNVLAINSVKTKHIESGSITAELIEAGAIKGEHITADNAFIDKINSNIVVSDLIMAGKIEGNNSYWDLDKGDFVLGNKLKFIDSELIIRLSGDKTIEETIQQSWEGMEVGSVNLYSNASWHEDVEIRSINFKPRYIDLYDLKRAIKFTGHGNYVGKSIQPKPLREGGYLLSFYHKEDLTVQPSIRVKDLSRKPPQDWDVWWSGIIDTEFVRTQRNAEGEYHRSFYKFSLPESYEEGVFFFGFTDDLEGGMEITVHSVKIETGNIFTDWSSAPEDADYRTDELQGEVTQSLEEVAIVKKEIKNLSEIMVTEDNIKTIVSEEIIYGGKNMLVNSDFRDDWKGFLVTTSTLDDTFKGLQDNDLKISSHGKELQLTKTDSGIARFSQRVYGFDSKAKQHVFSLYVKVAPHVKGKLLLRMVYRLKDGGVFNSSEDVYVDASDLREYTRVRHISTRDLSDVEYLQPQIRLDDLTPVDKNRTMLYSQAWKLEESDVMTAWSSNEADTYTKSEIDQKADSISATVSKQGKELAGLHIGINDINQGYVTLNGNTTVKGSFKVDTGTGSLTNHIGDGEFEVKDDGVTTMRLDGKSLRLYDKTQPEELVGRMYASRLLDSDGNTRDMGHFSVRHAYNKSIGIAREVSRDSTTAETYAMFDYHERSILTARGYPITMNQPTSFRGNIFMRWNDIWLTDTFVITPYRAGISFINDSTKKGLHISQSGLLYERDGNKFARVQLGNWGDL